MANLDFAREFQEAKAKLKEAKVTTSSFNEAIKGGSYLGEGEHPCTIQSAEAKIGEYGPQIEINWGDAQGATIRQYVSIIYEDKEGNVSLASAFMKLGQCLGTDIEWKIRYQNSILEGLENGDFTLIDALNGVKATVVVKKGTRGFEVVNSGGEIKVVDVATQEFLLEDQTFTSLGDAKDAAKKDGYKPMFPKVHYLKPLADELENNEQGLKKVLT